MRKTNRSFGSWQWQVIIVSLLGYAMYYFVRKNFSTAMPSLEAVFGITKTQLGLFLTINGIIYGVSRFVNGFIADRCSHRKFMATGLAISGLLNFGYAFSDKCAALIAGTATGPDFLKAITVVMAVILIFNGYVQGMGVPPVYGLMAKWVHPKELATKMSVWNMSHSIGAGLIFILGAVILKIAGVSAWRLFFIIPAIIAFAGSILIWTSMPDSPSEVGLEEIHKDNPEGKVQKSDPEYHRAFLAKRVFKNPVIWVLALVNFCVYIIRFSMLDWGMMILPGSKGVSIGVAAVMVAVFEFVGGNLGMLFFGWLTDHLFGG
ncbi:MAG: MFS transporter, partial [Bacteroidales bacterium]|nr:MFS transporter [Bacteroidales bacterium]